MEANLTGGKEIYFGDLFYLAQNIYYPIYYSNICIINNKI
jgi:hypothetical protein